jgi:hypothetical protein
MCFCNSGFSFKPYQWERVIIPPAPLPADASVQIFLDPAFTALETSDSSAIGASFTSEEGVLNILGCASGKWRGLVLPRRAADWVEKYPGAVLKIEKNPFFDLLADSIRLEVALRCIEPPTIVPFVPVSPKKTRIRRLQTLVEDVDAPRICIHRGSFVSELLTQIESFCFTNIQNHRRPDDLLDVLSMAAGFR